MIMKTYSVSPRKIVLMTVVGLGLLAIPMYSFAQVEPQIRMRFARPVFDRITRMYSLEVEATSNLSEEIFYGMNLRFFFDAAQLEFKALDQYAPGIDIVYQPPSASVGTDQSGVDLFGLAQAAGYVNGGLQAVDNRHPVVLSPGVWTRLCRATFFVPTTFLESQEFCPSLIWDKRPFFDQGGLLGSDGVLMAVQENDRTTRTDSRRTVVEGEPFNWQYSRLAGLPFGEPLSTHCISLATSTSIVNPAVSENGGYVLFQNQPNPFDAETMIEFILPYAQDAQLKFYNIQGQLLDRVTGCYPAGRNRILLQHKPWMDRAGIVYYQLVAGDHHDDVRLVRKMNSAIR